MLGPEKRPFYGAWRPDLCLWPEDTHYRLNVPFVVEVMPLEDCVPDSPVQVQIKSVLGKSPEYALLPIKAGDVVFLCDHYNDNPQRLYAGKTYLMCLRSNGTHDPQDVYGPVEYVPQAVTFSTQYRPDGTLTEDKITPPAIQEVIDGFYETEDGRHWLEYAGAIYNSYQTVPVLPTNRTQLLLPFYNGTAYVSRGEDITSEEYETGERVCLVSENFAKLNNITPGDTLRLPLYFADYQNAPNDRFPEVDHTTIGGAFEWNIGSPLNADGEPYPVFSDHDYTVKGIYSNMPGTDAAYAMGANTVVIPAASVRESDADNILAYGSMKDTTTTFQIPNGTIETFMKNWLLQGNAELDFTFHDRGYTQLHSGLENMKRISVLFLAIGSAMSLALVFFFCHVFISKNKMRTAIERMLGYTRKQCAASLLSGFLLAAVLAVAVGAAAGIYAEKQIANKLISQQYYDTSFTVGPLGGDGVALKERTPSGLYSPAAGLALLLTTTLVSVVFMRGNVKEEPLKLLGGRKE
ncbi:FtsX-like permease family protein [Sporobacter termitidis]|nr:FtsX-like permease family protein [Sporobacter termitidis]